MKHLIILGDGMADEPIESLGGKTPLQMANTPAMDYLAQRGKCGLLKSVPLGFRPGSEVANLAILGYNLPIVFEGRGSLEAASMGVEIEDGEMVMRCNLICIENERIKNHSAGYISNEEAAELISFLQEKLGNEKIHFFAGISFRNLLKIKGGIKELDCTPPHDVPGTLYKDVLVKALSKEAEPTAELLNTLIMKSQEILAHHPVNLKRIAEGKDPANSIWPWSAGYRPKMIPLTQIYNLHKGSVISAVDLIKGIGVYAGLKPIEVEGATGLWDTNYEGKAQATIEAIRSGDDFVFLHIEASDEAGHEGDVQLKMKTIEDLDHKVVAPIIKELIEKRNDVSVALLPDHPTPCRLRTHTNNPVPFVIYKPGEEGDGVQSFSESSAKEGAWGILEANEFIEKLMRE